MKKKVYLFFIIALCLAIFLGLTIFAFIYGAQDEFKKSVKLQAYGTTVKTYEINELALAPGDSKEYELIYYSSVSGAYKLQVNFVDKSGGTLKYYLNVEIEADGYKASGNLFALMAAEEGTELELYLEAKGTNSLKIRFIMPENIGNEAQGTTADFDIVVTARHSSDGTGT